VFRNRSVWNRNPALAFSTVYTFHKGVPQGDSVSCRMFELFNGRLEGSGARSMASTRLSQAKVMRATAAMRVPLSSTTAQARAPTRP